MSQNQVEIISNLRKYRKLAGLTLMELSSLTGLTSTSLSQWERGNRLPTVYNAIIIINALNNTLYNLKDSGLSVKEDLTLDKIWEIKKNNKLKI